MNPVISDSQVGNPIALTSSSGNHSPEQWAQATAQTIFNVDTVQPGLRLLAAMGMQSKAAAILSKYYHAALEREIEHLQTYVDHCDTAYDVSDLATKAVTDIQDAAEGGLWHGLTRGEEWARAAFETVASHLATALHVERLLFADVNPTNSSAVAYKTRINGT